MRNVIVTGASRGLGLSIAQTLAAAGYRAVAIARTESEALRTIIAEPPRAGQGSVTFRAFDLTELSGLGHLVVDLRKEFGPIFGLVNNAGLGTAGVLAMMRDEAIEKMVQLNTVAPMVLSKYVVRSMMIERAGRIVNIASIIAATGYSGLAAYAATKASMVGFTRSLAREVGSLGITVNAIAPGFVDTEMTHELAQEDRDRIVRRSALRRLVEPRDVAAAVEFLLSENAKNITGTTITVDAGNTA
jgi:3-oxoacyl-[acyl-carrier protein] reductase